MIIFFRTADDSASKVLNGLQLFAFIFSYLCYLPKHSNSSAFLPKTKAIHCLIILSKILRADWLTEVYQ